MVVFGLRMKASIWNPTQNQLCSSYKENCLAEKSKLILRRSTANGDMLHAPTGGPGGNTR